MVGGNFEALNDENRLSEPPMPDWLKLDCEKLRFDRVPIRELPYVVEGGSPCGVNEAADDRGGPAGVVDGLLARLCDLPGVDGGLESNGTLKGMMEFNGTTMTRN